MTPDQVLQAFGLPASAMQRTPVPRETIAKRALGSDRRALLDGLRSLIWVAVLKPGTVAIPAFDDGARDYREVQVMRATMRPGVPPARVLGPIHRALSYPTVVVAEADEGVALSFAHLRRHERREEAVVVDGPVHVVPLRDQPTDRAFLASLSLAACGGAHLYALYAGWIERALALEASRLTGVFLPPAGPEAAHARRERLLAVQALDERISSLTRQAERERSLALRVGLNSELAALREKRLAMVARLAQP